MENLSHVNEKGNAAMVDVSEKTDTLRIAKAQAEIIFPENFSISSLNSHLFLDNKATNAFSCNFGLFKKDKLS